MWLGGGGEGRGRVVGGGEVGRLSEHRGLMIEMGEGAVDENLLERALALAHSRVSGRMAGGTRGGAEGGEGTHFVLVLVMSSLARVGYVVKGGGEGGGVGQLSEHRALMIKMGSGPLGGRRIACLDLSPRAYLSAGIMSTSCRGQYGDITHSIPPITP